MAELGAPGKEPKFEVQHVCWEEIDPMTDIIEMLSSGGGVRKSMPILEVQVETLGVPRLRLLDRICQDLGDAGI